MLEENILLLSLMMGKSTAGAWEWTEIWGMETEGDFAVDKPSEN